MALKEFSFDPALAAQFINLPYGLYSGDPQWIPPIRKELWHRFSREYSSPEPDRMRHNFLALQGNRPVGRVSAFVNPQLHDSDGTPIGTIGSFECVKDYSVATDLFAAAVQWLRSHGRHIRVWGPMNYDIWNGYRLMTRGFDQKTFCTEPYNKPYYPEFFERFGFTPRQTWESVELLGRENMEAAVRRGKERYGKLLNQGYSFHPFDLNDYEEELHRLCELLNQSFGTFLGYTPTRFEQFRKIFDPNRHALDSSFFLFARDEHDQLAGFGGSFIDVSDGMRAMNGRDSAYARLKFRWHRSHSRRLILYIAGATSAEAEKHSGLGRATFYRIVREAVERGYRSLVAALIARGSVVRGTLGGMAAQAQREYALYELNNAVEA